MQSSSTAPPTSATPTVNHGRFAPLEDWKDTNRLTSHLQAVHGRRKSLAAGYDPNIFATPDQRWWNLPVPMPEGAEVVDYTEGLDEAVTEALKHANEKEAAEIVDMVVRTKHEIKEEEDEPKAEVLPYRSMSNPTPSS